MNINFNPQTVTSAARKAMLRLMANNRDEYQSYWFDDASQQTRTMKAITFRTMAGILRGVIPS